MFQNHIVISFLILIVIPSQALTGDKQVLQRLESLEETVGNLATLVHSSVQGIQQVKVHLVGLVQDLQDFTTKSETSNLHPNQESVCRTELENCKAKVSLIPQPDQSKPTETTLSRSVYNIWTLSPTGCQCYWDNTRTICACCVPGGCPCTKEAPFWCVKCGDTASCTQLATSVKDAAGPYNVWTVTPTGCQCYWDKSRTDCACCAPGGCACPRETPYWCVKCGDSAACSSFRGNMAKAVTEAAGLYNMWTVTPTGCQCYWDKSRTDCACCAPGGCACPRETPYWCVKCGDSAACSSFRRLVSSSRGC